MQVRSQVTPRVKSLSDAVKLQPSEIKGLLDQVDSQFLRDEKRQFASEGSSGGAKWQPLSEPYKRWKKKAFPGRKIMALTGKTRTSLTTTGSGHVATYSLSPRASVTVGTSVKTPAYHMNLSNNPLYNPRLPHRDVMQMTQKQERKYTQLAVELFTEIKLPRILKTLMNAKFPPRRRRSA